MLQQQAGYKSDSSNISLKMDISCSESDPGNSGDDFNFDHEFHDAMDHLLGAGYWFEPEAAERSIEIS